MRPAHDSVVTNVDDHADTGALHSIGREEANVLGLQGVLDKRGSISLQAVKIIGTIIAMFTKF